MHVHIIHCIYTRVCINIHVQCTCIEYGEQLYVFFSMCIRTLPPSLHSFLHSSPPPGLFSHSSTSHRKERVDEVPPGQTEENEPDLLGPEQLRPMVSLTMSTSDLTAVLEGHSLVSATHLPLYTPGATTVQSAQRKQRAIEGKVVMMGVKLGTTILLLHLPHTPESRLARIARCLHACVCLCSCMHLLYVMSHACQFMYLPMCRCNCMHNYMYMCTSCVGLLGSPITALPHTQAV